MKKLLPVLLLSSLALTACVVPYDYYDSGRQDGRDHYDQRYERYDDRYDAAMSAITTVMTTYRYRDGKYYDDDYIEHQIYSDPSFEQKRAQVMRILERRGYQVHEIEADDRRGRPVLKAEASETDANTTSFSHGRIYGLSANASTTDSFRQRRKDKLRAAFFFSDDLPTKKVV